MEKDYNAYFLEREAEMDQKRSELKAELEKQVEAQLATQMESVCATMRPYLIACWEKGGLGEEISEAVFIQIPKVVLSRTYREVLNEVVREKLGEYGFIAYFDCGKEKNPEVAEVHFNFTQAFYEERENWCHCLAQKYLAEKIRNTAMSLYQVIDLQLLSMQPGAPYKSNVKATVKLPPAARKIVAKGVCETIPRGITGWSLEGKDQIVFNVSVSM